MTCISCGRGFHDECDSEPCCCGESNQTSALGVPVDQSFSSSESVGRPKKADNEVTVSAGRKRAAATYEIEPDAPCEWRNLANCGGGKFPIIGCALGKQQHRHHGPVKNTTRNERKNIHRICVKCHNTWHAANDPVYNEAEFENLPHEPRELTMEEFLVRGFK